MLKNYFVTAFRNLWRGKVFSLINILGLSVGLTCCMLIFLYGKDEVSYDRFHKGGEHVFRVTSDMFREDGSVFRTGSTGMLPGPHFSEAIPEIRDFVRVQSAFYTVKKGTQVFEQEALYVDENFFSVFSFPLVAGNPKTALTGLHSVVLSEEMAQKYFGKKNAVGQTLELNTGEKFEPFLVSAVTRRTPQNSSIKIKMLVPMKFQQTQFNDKQWHNFFLNTFLVLKPGADPAAVSARMHQVFIKESAEELKEMKATYGYKDRVVFGLQPLFGMHLSTQYPADNGLNDASKPIYGYILTGIAIFILIIACINFINLTIARSLKRAKEIGIRKVVGGARKQLIIQFLGESFMLSLIAFTLALILVQVSLPFFNQVANKALNFSYLMDASLVAGYIGLFLVTGLLAGLYPAFVLSRFKPVETLYGRLRFGGKNYLARGLVVFQFALATFFIIATFIIYSQFNYLMNYNLGYDDKNIAIVNTGVIDRKKLDVFRNELKKDPSIVSVTADQGGDWETIARINGGSDIEFNFKYIDENFFPQFKIPMAAGRNFSADFSTDTAEAIIINEAFARTAAWKEPIGKQVDFFYYNKKFTVVGVVKDYHYASLSQKIKPQLFIIHPRYQYRNVYIKIKEGNTAQTLKGIEKVYKSMFPFQPYQHNFKDQQNEEQYAKESMWKMILTFGAILTIFISCIGLFGLATLSAEKRTKEIGIRKVLGASPGVIVKKLSADFMRLVLIASVIAIPAAWWVMGKWLEDYPYRIQMNWWMFGIATLIVAFIALFTISFQSVRAALANPVKSLRSE